MGPRKKSKPNPKAAKSQSTLPEEASQVQGLQEAPDGTAESKASQTGAGETQVEGNASPTASSKPEAQADAKKTWYGGTWPRTPKATPVTQVAKESISAAGAVASEAISSAQRRVSPRRATPGRKPSLPLGMGKDFGGSVRSLPLAATTTKLHITSSPSDTGSSKRDSFMDLPYAGNATNQAEKPEQSNDLTLGAEGKNRISQEQHETKGSTADRLDADDKTNSAEKGTDASSGGWMGWFSRAPNSTEEADPKSIPLPQDSCDDSEIVTTKPKAMEQARLSDKGRRKSDPNPVSPTFEEPASRSWLGLWNYTTATSEQSNPAKQEPASAQNPPEAASSTKSENSKPSTVPPSVGKPTGPPADSGKSYGWAFWSKEPSDPDNAAKPRRTSTGELAIAGSPSQSKLEKAELNETKLPNKAESRNRPRSLDTKGAAFKQSVNKDVEEKPPKPTETRWSAAQASKDEALAVKAISNTINLLLPPLDRTYPTIEKPGLLQQLSRLLQYNKSSLNNRHVHRQDPPRIKRALAIVSSPDLIMIARVRSTNL